MIRPAVPGDAAAIAAFWNPQIRDTVVTFSPLERSPDEIIAMITQRQAFVVADLGDGPIGFATYAQFRSGPGYAFAQEHTIILSPQASGKGVGRALMTAIEDIARGHGHRAMIAGVSGSNPAGIAFHAAIGYLEVGRLPQVGWKLGSWHDLVLMQKLL
ncbi:GNAT family N-acetyltransferase [Pararhodobacter zhoushanensis]|uniref:GNAT family N-acetyltransferase n=1 Tax=Pararhodobacter zhoushanensis TaxID=2479545 RepID=A0ABT3H328_9RHOB|nr:GNAT family N-acetyltransferase [Pararhodobacter zhoushanensis]MCW1934235.1 GNAT family N-acetyltransferase [Pararhodobacter zhoushanensis]